MAKIIVMGGSSGIGLETVKQALEQGHAVTAFSRSASKIELEHPNLIKMDGDALSPEDVALALGDIDVVIQTLGVPLNARMLLGPITLFSEATKVLLPAMQSAGIKKLITVTGFGAGDSEQSISLFQKLPFNAVFGRAYSDKSIQEGLIKDSDLDWVIARPGVLTNGSRTEYDIISDRKKWRNGVISRADVAHFLVSQIDSAEYDGVAPVLRGSIF